jgi:hypothetical protein
MTIKEYNSNRELTESELETVTGGSLRELVETAVQAALDAPPGNGSYLGGKSGVSSLVSLNLNKPNPA